MIPTQNSYDLVLAAALKRVINDAEKHPDHLLGVILCWSHYFVVWTGLPKSDKRPLVRKKGKTYH